MDPALAIMLTAALGMVLAFAWMLVRSVRKRDWSDLGVLLLSIAFAILAWFFDAWLGRHIGFVVAAAVLAVPILVWRLLLRSRK